MLNILHLSAALLLLEAASSLDFMIKHRMSGKYIHPYRSDQPISDNDPLVIWNSHTQRMTFDIVDGEWGYIRHVGSGKIFHPEGGSMTPSDNTVAVLHSDHAPWAYFALDQVNNHIIHRGGKYIHPHEGTAYPDDNTQVVLHGAVHSNMEFQLVSSSNPNQEVYPYGDAHITGEWKLVFSVENPLATHTETIQTKIGISESESMTSSFKFVWESEISAQFFFAKMSTSTSLTEEIKKSSSQTWHAEITKTDSVQVVAGETVAVWQKHFIGEQLGHKGVHQSNMFADTNSPNIKPDDYAYTQYRFI